jgi:hypothetical protein
MFFNHIIELLEQSGNIFSLAIEKRVYYVLYGLMNLQMFHIGSCGNDCIDPKVLVLMLHFLWNSGSAAAWKSPMKMQLPVEGCTYTLS